MQPSRPIHELISEDIRGMPKKLFKFKKTDTNNKLHYYNPYIKVGSKSILCEVTEYDHRYQFNYPQIVQIDERYLCLIGGTKNSTFDFGTP